MKISFVLIAFSAFILAPAFSKADCLWGDVEPQVRKLAEKDLASTDVTVGLTTGILANGKVQSVYAQAYTLSEDGESIAKSASYNVSVLPTDSADSHETYSAHCKVLSISK